MTADHDDGFLNRWSRRKQRAGRQPASRPAEPVPDQQPTQSARGEPAPAQTEAERQELIDSLPEPEQLGPEDDFSQFLQEGVPDDLRQRALRRLWRSNPVFANLDGLNDYDLDYTDAATVVENLKTAFQVGRGMVTKDERAAEAAAAERAARGESPGEAPADPGGDPDGAPGPEGGAQTDSASAIDTPGGAAEEAAADAGDQADAPGARARYRQSPDGRVRVKGSAAQRRWGV
jgi:hypothetical protein